MSRTGPFGGQCAWVPSPGCRSPAAGPTRCSRPAALPIPRNQVCKVARRALTQAQRHRGQDPGARSVCSAFRAAGAGEVWSPRGARSRTPGPGSPERPGALPVRPGSPEPSLSLAAPKDRPGDGVSRGHGERERASGRARLRRGCPSPTHSVASTGAESSSAPRGPAGGTSAPPPQQPSVGLQTGLNCAPRLSRGALPHPSSPRPGRVLAPPAPCLRPAGFYPPPALGRPAATRGPSRLRPASGQLGAPLRFTLSSPPCFDLCG